MLILEGKRSFFEVYHFDDFAHLLLEHVHLSRVSGCNDYPPIAPFLNLHIPPLRPLLTVCHFEGLPKISLIVPLLQPQKNYSVFYRPQTTQPVLVGLFNVIAQRCFAGFPDSFLVHFSLLLSELACDKTEPSGYRRCHL